MGSCLVGRAAPDTEGDYRSIAEITAPAYWPFACMFAQASHTRLKLELSRLGLRRLWNQEHSNTVNWVKISLNVQQ